MAVVSGSTATSHTDGQRQDSTHGGKKIEKRQLFSHGDTG